MRKLIPEGTSDVDALKASGNFTKENQEEALKKAVEQAERLLTAEARSFLEKA